jgi:hypothetical protein
VDKKNIGDVIICDDVRHENNGKQILIGVYGSNIVVQSIPFMLNLSIWLEYNAPKRGEDHVHIRFLFESKPVSGVEIRINVLDPGLMTIATPQLPVHGASEGWLSVELSSDGKKWGEIKRKRVQAGSSPAAPPLSHPLPPG